MWTLEEACDLIRGMQSDVRALDFHICLGGGVLNTGISEKDLDLFLLPLNGIDAETQALMRYLYIMLGPAKALRDGPDYNQGTAQMYREMVKYTIGSRRIDVFVL